MEDKPVEIVEYRGYSVPIYMDDYGQCFYCELDGEEIGFGSYNTEYKDDLYYLIDKKLDTIHVFENPYYGARLEWFENGYTNRDIKLVYRTRILKVFLVDNESDITCKSIDRLKYESEQILDKLINK